VKRAALLMALAAVALIVAVPTAAAGGGCHGGTPGLGISTGTEKVVPVSKCAFRQTVTYIEAGDSLTWTNKDPLPHTVTGVNLSWGSERYLDQGDTVRYSFKSDGVYPYYCVLHPGMVGAVVVGDATAAAALTNGYANVEEIRLSGEPATASDVEQTASTPSNLGLVVTLAAAIALIAGVFVTRGALARRRATITTTL